MNIKQILWLYGFPHIPSNCKSGGGGYSNPPLIMRKKAKVSSNKAILGAGGILT